MGCKTASRRGAHERREELNMRRILDFEVGADQAALWFLGQAGYIMKSCGTIVAIDPYLSDSAGKVYPQLSRALPVPIKPGELEVDIYIVTHDHLDHLDPETIEGYRHKESAVFVAPRLACKKLLSLGISRDNISRIDTGETGTIRGVKITGIYTVPNAPEVIDTAGYVLEFENSRSVYHSSDTAFSPLLLEAVGRAEVALVCINGKWGNLSPREAAELAAKVAAKAAIPNHYDIMALNSENPKTFEYEMRRQNPDIPVKILSIMEPFVW